MLHCFTPLASANTATSSNKHQRTGSMTSSFSEFSRKMRPKTLQMDGNKPSIYKSSSVPMNLQTDISPGKINYLSQVTWVLWLVVVHFYPVHFMVLFYFPLGLQWNLSRFIKCYGLSKARVCLFIFSLFFCNLWSIFVYP